jgi:hypothetical protein
MFAISVNGSTINCNLNFEKKELGNKQLNIKTKDRSRNYFPDRYSTLEECLFMDISRAADSS